MNTNMKPRQHTIHLALKCLYGDPHWVAAQALDELRGIQSYKFKATARYAFGSTDVRALWNTGT